MKFYIDENVDPAVATGLRLRGIDAIATQEAGLKGSSDEQQIAFASVESRVIVTHDADLLRMDRRGVAHAGVVYVGANRNSLGHIIHKLVLLHETVSAKGHAEPS